MALFFENLETDRLLLKNISMEDADFIFAQFSDPVVCKYLYDEEPFTSRKQAEELIGYFCQPEPRNQHRWIVVRKADGARMGTCGFHHWNREERSVETGYDLREEFWGSGYMTEAMRRIIGFATERMDLLTIYGNIYVENQSSIALAERLGFKKSGSSCEVFRGESMPHHVYTLYCTEALGEKISRR
jgi:ribosomal-protein-alanine N-acetyltransferase